MIKYRSFQETDFDSIKFLCDKNKINLPHQNSLIVVAEEEGNLEGFIGMAQLTFIEPLISENPVVANNLYHEIAGAAIGQGVKELYCYCDENKRELFEKSGFSIFQTDKILMKKNI